MKYFSIFHPGVDFLFHELHVTLHEDSGAFVGRRYDRISLFRIVCWTRVGAAVCDALCPRHFRLVDLLPVQQWRHNWSLSRTVSVDVEASRPREGVVDRDASSHSAVDTTYQCLSIPKCGSPRSNSTIRRKNDRRRAVHVLLGITSAAAESSVYCHCRIVGPPMSARQAFCESTQGGVTTKMGKGGWGVGSNKLRLFVPRSRVISLLAYHPRSNRPLACVFWCHRCRCYRPPMSVGALSRDKWSGVILVLVSPVHRAQRGRQKFPCEL